MERRRNAQRHQRAILAAVGQRRLVWTARHVICRIGRDGTSRHPIAHARMHIRGNGHAHRGLEDRHQQKASNGESREEATEGGPGHHALKISRSRWFFHRRNLSTGRELRETAEA
jgi:hypothetical protein